MKKITNFIWDFDGMLFDTYPHTLAVFCEYCRRTGRAADPAEVYGLMKITLRHAFAHYGFTPADVAAFYEMENDLDFLPRGVPYPRIPEILRLIVSRGGKNYLYTHRDRVALQYLELYGLKDLFADFITGEDGFPWKPAPDALLSLMAKHALSPENCLMLGDRDIDVGAGVNAGMQTLLFDDEGRYAAPVGETYRCGTAAALEQTVDRLTAQ